MKLYPVDTFEKLEFDKVIDLLKKECLGEGGINKVSETHPSSNLAEINDMLDQVWEYVESFERNDQIPLSNYEDIRNELYLLKKEGYVLSVEEIKKLYHTVSIGKMLAGYFDSLQRRKLASKVYAIYEKGKGINPKINLEIDRVIDEEGEIRPNASEALMKIHKKITAKEKELLSAYSKIIHDSKSKGLLSDTVESYRNGRRVLTLPAENKRKLGGIIHDESSTGKTVFIEPNKVIPINNDIYNLYTEKKKEIYKVLKDLCDQLRPFTDDFMNLFLSVVELDVIRAKARLAKKLDAYRPNVQEKPTFNIKHGFHPILKYKYDKEGRTVVPFDAELHGKNFVLVISGPNAGGKSVSMKSIGLLQLMVQSGMCVPADPNSTFGIYHNLFVDIGDQQSMEDDLSTYSSHLKNMKHFTEHADAKTLFLIDEFGSGTDPKIGGAIAEAVLKDLHKKKASGVITTHYSNLKYFAFKAWGIVNGSMEFDTELLQPTFVLKIGKPGSSFAYEIATKSGLSNEIIKYAKHKTGKNEKAIDELLVKLQDEKQETEEKMANVMEKEDRLNRLIKNYEELHRELEYRRKKIKLSQKEQALFQLGEDNRTMQKLVKEMKESKSLEDAKKLAKEFKEKKAETVKEITTLKEDVYYNIDIDESLLIEGKFAKMRTGTQTGKILKIKKGVAELQMGFIKMKIPLKELIPAGEPIEVSRSISVKTNISTTREKAKSKVDIRGYLPSDAVQVVEELVDNALIFNVNFLTILHGRGNGVLRKVVHKKLKEYKEVKSVTHPPDENGGEGVSYVKL